jgi:F0F1-type ATP synthase epsilon subunit
MQKDKIKLQIITPDKTVVDEDYNVIFCPGEAGDFELLANHENFISKLKTGVISVNNTITQSFIVSQSFMKFDHANNICKIIVEFAIAIQDIKSLGNNSDITKKITQSHSEKEKEFYQFISTFQKAH